ncbi:MAG: hypothetical protein Tsb009_32270 [Planctomycetaceae bacterium]
MLTTIRLGRDFLLLAMGVCVCLMLVHTGHSQNREVAVQKTAAQKTVAKSVDTELAKKGITQAIRESMLTKYTTGITKDKSGKVISAEFGPQFTDGVTWLLATLTDVQSLDLTGCTQLSDKGIATLKNLKKLKHLSLARCSRISDEGLDHLKGLTSLTSLDLTYCRFISNAGLAKLKPLTQLTELNLSQCSRISNEGLAHLKAFPNLEKLNLSYCRSWNDEGAKHLTSLQKLTELDLTNTIVGDEGLKTIASMPSLKTLNLKYCSRYSLKGIQSLASGKAKLTSLVVSQNRSFKDDSLKAVSRITSLEHLDLDSTGITDVGLKSLQTLKNLTSLQLSSTTITDKGLESLATLKNLEELKLYNAQISDAGIAKLKPLQKMRSIDLGYCKKITDTAIKTVASFPKLERLDLRSTNVGDPAMESLKNAKNLTDLNLSYCRRITPKGLSKLAGLKKLQTLGLQYTNASTLTMTHLSGLTELRDLNLRSCKSITSISPLRTLKNLESLNLGYLPITALAVQNMKKLKYLSLYGTAISDAGITNVLGLKNLKHLDLQRTRLTANGFSRVRTALRGTLVLGSPVVSSSLSYKRTQYPSNSSSVRVVIQKELNISQKRELLEKFKAAAGLSENVFYSISENATGTVFELSPVDDPAKLASQLKTAQLISKAKIDTSPQVVTSLIKGQVIVELSKSALNAPAPMPATKQ